MKKIYVSHSKDFDFINELYKPIRESALNGEYEFFLPHENDRPVNTQDIIKNSDTVLAEVSFSATGQGIELGWANVFGVPIICISKDGIKISGCLKYITDTFLTYSDTKELIERVSDFLKKN